MNKKRIPLILVVSLDFITVISLVTRQTAKFYGFVNLDEFKKFFLSFLKVVKLTTFKDKDGPVFSLHIFYVN